MAGARHEDPVIDEAALAAAREADRLLTAARTHGAERWFAYLEPLPDHLRDDDLSELRRTALRVRAAYGAKDSVRDVLPPSATEPLLDAVDHLLRLLARRDAHR